MGIETTRALASKTRCTDSVQTHRQFHTCPPRRKNMHMNAPATRMQAHNNATYQHCLVAWWQVRRTAPSLLSPPACSPLLPPIPPPYLPWRSTRCPPSQASLHPPPSHGSPATRAGGSRSGTPEDERKAGEEGGGGGERGGEQVGVGTNQCHVTLTHVHTDTRAHTRTRCLSRYGAVQASLHFPKPPYCQPITRPLPVPSSPEAPDPVSPARNARTPITCQCTPLLTLFTAPPPHPLTFTFSLPCCARASSSAMPQQPYSSGVNTVVGTWGEGEGEARGGEGRGEEGGVKDR